MREGEENKRREKECRQSKVHAMPHVLCLTLLKVRASTSAYKKSVSRERNPVAVVDIRDTAVRVAFQCVVAVVVVVVGKNKEKEEENMITVSLVTRGWESGEGERLRDQRLKDKRD